MHPLVIIFDHSEWLRFWTTKGKPISFLSSRRTRTKIQGIIRPVSFTLVPWKVREQIILKNISGHMEDKNISNSKQIEFTKGKACWTNLICYYDTMTILRKAVLS